MAVEKYIYLNFDEVIGPSYFRSTQHIMERTEGERFIHFFVHYFINISNRCDNLYFSASTETFNERLCSGSLFFRSYEF